MPAYSIDLRQKILSAWQNKEGTQRDLVGLRQKVARKSHQTYIQRGFDIVLTIFLIYLGFKHF